MARETFRVARNNYYSRLQKEILTISENGIPSNADKSNKSSRDIAKGIMERLGNVTVATKRKGQILGNAFEDITLQFIEDTFPRLNHLMPSKWTISRGTELADYEQYTHLAALQTISGKEPELAASLGNDYTIRPDIVIYREPYDDEEINANELLIDKGSKLTCLRKSNNGRNILHASISCKWTLRSDRAQNARSEALNLVRNRKGRTPHIAVVTAEPMPSRIASIALGTGDVDCVYHFALNELKDTLNDLNKVDAIDMLNIMIRGKRLKDISDLPLDLVV